MKVRIEVDMKTEDTEVIIKCREISDEVIQLQSALRKATKLTKPIVFHKKDQEFFFPLREILFFETDPQGVTAHTTDDVYYVKFRLYELEDLLPDAFVRVSKSTIANSDKIYSILRNITSASKIEFQNTHKKIYVSRNYYKQLKDKLTEKRNRYE